MTTPAYETLIEICRTRMTMREFDPNTQIPKAHFDLILEAARHGPSGANAQPWYFIVVTEPDNKELLAAYFKDEASRRAHLGMKFPTPNYRGIATAPGVILVVADFRYVNAYPRL